ncbi:Hypothetical protein HVR_LOCUS12 [uncultured virus]|nr:Hypothetical protein HVR_LOCUS12 [uncultured virus]
MAIPTHMAETVANLQQVTNEILRQEGAEVFGAVNKLYQVREQVRKACAEGNLDKFNQILSETGYHPFLWKGFFGVNATTPTSIFDLLLDRFGFSPIDEEYALNECLVAGNQTLYDHAKLKFEEAKNQTYSDSESEESDKE